MANGAIDIFAYNVFLVLFMNGWLTKLYNASTLNNITTRMTFSKELNLSSRPE